MKLLVALLFTLSFSVQAKTIKVKFATVAPAGTPWASTLQDIKKQVEKDSKKSIKVKNYLGGQLGGELEILQKIRRGRIQGGGLTSAALANVVPEMDVLEMPYLFDSYEQADYILDKYMFKIFKKLFAKKGLYLLTWAENGWRNIGLKKGLVKKVSDIKGIKVRSQESKTHLAFWKKIGANPVPIAIPEVLPALQTGVVQGFDNTALFTLAAEWHSAIKYFTITEHIYQPAAVVYSTKFWKKLNKEQKKILIGKGNKLAPESRAAVRAMGAELVNVMKESGITVYKLSKKERAAFKKSVGNIHSKLVKEIGGDADKIYKLILKGKKEFAKL